MCEFRGMETEKLGIGVLLQRETPYEEIHTETQATEKLTSLALLILVVESVRRNLKMNINVK